MTPFIINISQAVLDDLKMRIRNTRWPDTMDNSGWTFGASLDYMKELAVYWSEKFDWRKTEHEINSYPNFIAEIDGYKVHFLHIKGKGKKTFPLIITHGWPGSFLEMMKLIPLLTENKDFSFDLVIPSMMGYGFSQKITVPGNNVGLMADVWFKLMQQLGYDKFGAQGGDFGAGVSTALALKYPNNVAGLHLNYIPGNYYPYLPDGEQWTPEETQFDKDDEDWYRREGAYSHQHKTKPLTLAYGLHDSPIGMAAWIVEKLYGWADCKGNVENVFTKDELLSHVMLYWVTETMHSSIRLYYENSKVPMRFGKNDFINVPVSIARFPFEEPFPPRKFIERGFNIRRWTDMPTGGHFAAIEQPQLLANDLIEFFQTI
ncbi:epoxide hydrolase [bacterium]|nr:epoxide hydrolase [bacterium]